MTQPSHTQTYKTRQELKEFWNSLAQKQFVGYIVVSDRPLQHILVQPDALPSWEAIHGAGQFEPGFIVEAALYEKDAHSIMIRQADNVWAISEVKWNGSPFQMQQDFICHEYLLSGKGSEKKAFFQEAWLPEKDPLCQNFEVLKPAWIAFVGFEKQGENK